ncbi:MAG: hypothetical protein PVH68_08175 [Armatimonadota bacterium]|jgi:hypothetical protein
MRGALLVAVALPMMSVGYGKTALEHLQEAPKPRFRAGHTLARLTRWGWTMPFEVRVELAEHWGYALEFGGYASPRGISQLEDPESVASRICALTASDPERYPLCVLLHRACNSKEFREGLPDEAWCRDADGNLIEGKKRWSPEAPDEVFEQAAALAVEPLQKIMERAPVAIVLNGGEYGLNVYGFSKTAWQSDPRVMKAKGDRSWFSYISERKAHQDQIIMDAVRQAVPAETLYIYYHTGAAHRKRYGSWWHWAHEYEQLRKISDMASSSIYYKHFNTGWTGENDMLTQALNSLAQQMEFGDALSYNWMCAGWTREKQGEAAFGDLERYVGYLKCYYTAGMIGGVAGYFAHPEGGFGADVGDEAPHWLRQMMVLGRVQALFSHLEDFLRNGELLSGPERHRWSQELPAYELPTGDADARVLARKHKERSEWLITAWAAGGDEREVAVTVPELGEVRLLARPCGSVYRAALEDGRAVLTLVDEDGMLPSREQ